MKNSSGLTRVSRRTPCPICNHVDWCGLIDEGRVAICMRVSTGAISESANGGYVHVLRESETWKPQPLRSSVAKTQTSLAPIERRHEVYSALLKALTLRELHADDLWRRGLFDTFVAYNLFASTPTERTVAKLCAKLAASFDLCGVPGFYRESGTWRLAISDWHTGYFVPVRDVAGRIQALQTRRDKGEPRYCWLSSKGKADGVTSGASPHFAAPWRIERGSVIVTEGALKAEVIAQFIDSSVIGLAGVTNYKPGFGAGLKALGVERVQLAFDADWRTNRAVCNALTSLGELLRQARLTVSILDWQASNGKGLDDLLAKEAA